MEGGFLDPLTASRRLLAPSPAHLQGLPEELQLLSPTQPNGKRPQP